MCKRCIWCSVLITSDAHPMSINTGIQVQTDQCTALRFQDSFMFHSKMLNWITNYFIMCFLRKIDNYQKCTLPIQALCSTLYIHTDEQTAVFVIADDKISTIYLTRHQYFSNLKIFAAKCQCLWCLSTVFNALYIILHLLTFDLIYWP